MSKNKQVQLANKAISDAMHFIKEVKANPNAATAVPAKPTVAQTNQQLRGAHFGSCTTKTQTSLFSNLAVNLLLYPAGIIIQGQTYAPRAGVPFISLFSSDWNKLAGNGATASYMLRNSNGNNAIWLVMGGVGRTTQLFNLVAGATLTLSGPFVTLKGATSHPYSTTIQSTMRFHF